MPAYGAIPKCLGAPRSSYSSFGGLLFAGIDHVDRTAVPSVFDGKRYNAADAYELQPKLKLTAEKFEARLRDSFEPCLVALSPDIRYESLIKCVRIRPL